jgi:hypothetical protein
MMPAMVRDLDDPQIYLEEFASPDAARAQLVGVLGEAETQRRVDMVEVAREFIEFFRRERELAKLKHTVERRSPSWWRWCRSWRIAG